MNGEWESRRCGDTRGTKWFLWPLCLHDSIYIYRVMIKILRTDSDNKDFIELVKHLDAELALRDGADHSFYSQFNKIDKIRHAVVLYEEEKPVACGAIREFDPRSMEVKRMYTLPEFRGKGLGSVILEALESWSSEMNYERCVLETGKRQPEAIALYQKNGYAITPNYGQYIGVENSVCFEKNLQAKSIERKHKA